MANWLNRVLHHDKQETEIGRSDPTNLLATLDSARQTSLHPDNFNDVIVVVDMGAVIDAKTGPHVRQRFNFYTYRGAGDYNKMVHLKAAYVNGMRVDTLTTEMSGRVADVVLPDKCKEVTIEGMDPLALGGRKAVPDEPSLATMDALDLPTRTYARDRKPQPESEEPDVLDEPESEVPTLATMETLDLPTLTYARGRKLEPEVEEPEVVDEPESDVPTLATMETLDLPSRTYARDRKVEEQTEEPVVVEEPEQEERTLATMDSEEFEPWTLANAQQFVYSSGTIEVEDSAEEDGPTLATMDPIDLPAVTHADTEHEAAAR